MKLIEPTALPTWSRDAVEVLVQHPVGVSVDCSVKVAHPALLLLPFNVPGSPVGPGEDVAPLRPPWLCFLGFTAYFVSEESPNV